MVKVKKKSSLPPNFDDLPVYLKIQIEEDVYRRQMSWTHGHCPGDPRLSSMGADGIPISGSFGKKVEQKDDEEEI
jgi:hypothetical protein